MGGGAGGGVTRGEGKARVMMSVLQYGLWDAPQPLCPTHTQVPTKFQSQKGGAAAGRGRGSCALDKAEVQRNPQNYPCLLREPSLLVMTPDVWDDIG